MLLFAFSIQESPPHTHTQICPYLIVNDRALGHLALCVAEVPAAEAVIVQTQKGRGLLYLSTLVVAMGEKCTHSHSNGKLPHRVNL
jgi:hypothetical protein